jgi:hypothetical protein
MGLNASTAFRPFTQLIELALPLPACCTRTKKETTRENENFKRSKRSSGQCVNAQR